MVSTPRSLLVFSLAAMAYVSLPGAGSSHFMPFSSRSCLATASYCSLGSEYGIRLGKMDQPARGRVLPVEVYLAGLERLPHLLVAAEARPVDDRGVGRLEDLDGDVAEDLLLGEALGPDGELGVPLRAAQPELVPGDLYLVPARASSAGPTPRDQA